MFRFFSVINAAFYAVFFLFSVCGDALSSDALNIPELEKDAAAGDAEALFMLGDCCQFGNSVPRDEIKAGQCYLAAMEKGHSEAAVRMAFRYIEGLGVNSDPEKGWKILNDGVKNGDEAALIMMALMHMQGLHGIPKGMEKAEQFLMQVKNKEEAGLILFLLYLKTRQGEKAAELLQSLDETTEDEKKILELARLMLSICGDMEGWNGSKNPLRAMENMLQFLSKLEAAPADEKKMKAFLYKYISEIQNDSRLEVRAFENLRDSLELQENSRLCRVLASWYREGFGTEKNEMRAKELLLQASREGDAEAMFLEAVLFELPKGTEGNESAYELLMRAARAGSWRAMALLARLALEEKCSPWDALAEEFAVYCLMNAMVRIYQECEANQKDTPTLGPTLEWEYTGGGTGNLKFGFWWKFSEKKLFQKISAGIPSLEELNRIPDLYTNPDAVTASWEVPLLLAECYRCGRGTECDPELEKSMLRLLEEWK